MKRPCQFFSLVLVYLTLSSCSFNKVAVNSSSGLLYSSSKEVEAESNYEIFKLGLPGNLLLMEGLLSESPDNLDILATLTKGYAGYAFAINETDMQNEEWGELKTEVGKNQALLNYTRALNFGLRYLKNHKIQFDDLISKMSDLNGFINYLEKNLSGNISNLEVVLFTAQSFAALINIQKDNISMVAQLPVAKAMFDWVCTKNPKINYGMCDIFYGAFEAGRPKMLGGNPEKGKEIFLKAIIAYPNNWLIRTSYLQYYLIPQNDKEGFEQQLAYLKIKQQEYNGYYVYSSNSTPVSQETNWNQEVRVRFYQSLALKRYELINKYQKTFF